MLALVAALALSAQPSNSWLEEARELVAQLDFGEALARLEIAAQVPGNDGHTRQAIVELKAYCLVAQGRFGEAEQAFTDLLELDPNAVPSSTLASPKVLERFEAARKAHFPPTYVQLAERPAPPGMAQLTLIDPWRQVAAVVALLRVDGGAWVEQALVAVDGVRSLPLRVEPGQSLQWYVEARGAEGNVVATLATASSPRVVLSEPVSVTPVTAPRSFWSGRRVAGVVSLGVGLALAGIATGLQVDAWNQRVSARDRSRPPGDAASTALAAERLGLQQQGWAVGAFVGAGLAVGLGVVLAW